jgi:outer membrane protein TolC
MTASRLLFLVAGAACAQQPLTLGQVVRGTLDRYPAIRVSQEQIQAASSGIALARTAYLPKIDALAQINRATRNNLFGLVLPQSTLPSISGPVIGSNNTGTVWGSAIGGLVSWEPFDFGQRKAGVELATATRAQATAALERTQFEVAAAAADAYLTLAAAQEAVRAAQAGVERAETVARTIGAQVGAQLRPGADESRATAEVAAARTQLIQSEQAVAVARANLAQYTGGDPAQVAIDPQRLLQPAPAAPPPAMEVSRNPVLLEQNAVIEQTRAQLHVLERSYFPHFALQGAAYARGTGAETNGERLGGVNGLAPTVQNFAAGVSVTFTISELAALRARESAQSASLRAQSARADQLALELRTQWNRAAANLEGARRVAANTPVQVTAARNAAQQATARYQAGLGNIDEVAEAQRLLTQSEIDDALARLSVWRALLAIATAGGDLAPFLSEVGQ